MAPSGASTGIHEAVSYPKGGADEAIRLYTLNAAYSSGEESLKGSIEEGKLADLTILAEDPAAVSPDKIKDIVVDFVVLNGKLLIVTA